MKQSARLREQLLAKALDPFSGQTRKHVARIAFLGWVGLGADGLSSSCFGPEGSFLALGPLTAPALYLAAATAFTVFVFVIAIGYNQVIELFPNGGGGYASRAVCSERTPASCQAQTLIVDYVLTISTSIAAVTILLL
jgi:hypothetical protein